ncbi:hypothetical protein ACFTZI_20790 [Streptomyces decoyicus]|uniref:hypothetical protein n=1 Tax=Streptomyces decoyicus TaxID=249567 RepID=UPI003643F3F0
MNEYSAAVVEAWARELAEHAGVGYVPIVESQPLVTHVLIKYLFEAHSKFEVCQVTMWLVQLGYKAQVSKHADMWLMIETSIPNEKFETYEVDEDGRPTADQVRKMRGQGKTFEEIGDIFDLDAGHVYLIVSEEDRAAIYVRSEDDGQELNPQQQAAHVWDALEARGIKPVTVDGAKVDPMEELSKLLVEHESAQWAARAKKAHEMRRSEETDQGEETDAGEES